MVSPIPRSTRLPARVVAERTEVSRREARHDAGLVQRFNSGDEAAFVEIVTRYRPKMFAHAVGFLRNHADAEEIAQDTFIRAHRSLAKFRGETSLAAWLYLITLNLSRNRYWYLSRRRHTAIPLDAPCGEGSPTTVAELAASDALGPVHEATTREFTAIVIACMEQLPSAQREILALRNVQQHSYRHIGRRLGIGVGTAKSRIARARSNLRLLLGQACPEFHDAALVTWFEPRRPAGDLATANH